MAMGGAQSHLRVDRQRAVGTIRRSCYNAGRRQSEDELSPVNQPHVAQHISRLQQVHGNAFVARYLSTISRAADVQEEGVLDKPKSPGPLIDADEPPPGYRSGGTRIELAKPKPCGKSYYLNQHTRGRFIPNHIQTGPHWVAHELDIKSGETCASGHSISVKDIVAEKKRIPFGQAEIGDIWTDLGTQVGIVVALVKTATGRTEYMINYFEPGQCQVAEKHVTGGFVYK